MPTHGPNDPREIVTLNELPAVTFRPEGQYGSAAMKRAYFVAAREAADRLNAALGRLYEAEAGSIQWDRLAHDVEALAMALDYCSHGMRRGRT